MSSRSKGSRPSTGSGGRGTQEDNEELTVWRKITSTLKSLDATRSNAVTNITNLNTMKKSLSDDISGFATKLTALLKEGIIHAEREQKYSKEAIEQLGILIALRDASEAEMKRLTKKRRTDDESVSTPESTNKKSKRDRDSLGPPIPIGTEVAFKTPKPKTPDESWFLARILRYFADKNKYEVQDVEAEGGNPPDKYIVPSKTIVPLAAANALVPPKRGDRDRDCDSSSSSLSPPPASFVQPEFSPGTEVMALYPGTTCFYKAKVVLPPSKILSSREPVYKLRFEDDDNQERQVERRMVIPSI